MLSEQARRVLSWATALVVAAVIISGMASILSSLVRPGQEAPSLNVSPPGVNLCQGERIAFAVEPPLADVEWAATGGEITADGLYTAGELPGDYEVQAAGPGGERGRALVHIIACTPTPTVHAVASGSGRSRERLRIEACFSFHWEIQ
ncbi:MAG TPA: hypothetical protein EYP77_06345, partial [Anaerolineae bacterium]|nr:hypothetical protein [Anaerolineae bacterium]